MKIKKIISPICFIVVLFFMLHQITNIFYPVSATYATYQTYEKLEKNTVQVLALGTSSTYNAWIVPKIWNESGVAMYTIATSAQPFGITTEILDEALKSQKPEVILIDLHGFRSQTYNYSQSRIRPIIDNFGMLGRFKHVYNILEEGEEYAKENDTASSLNNEDYSYYFPLIKYHTMWKEGLQQENFTGQESEYLGYYTVIGNRSVEKTVVTTDKGEILDSQKKAIEDLIEYGKTCEAQIVFTCVPSQLNYEEQIEINTAIEMFEEAGYPVINMNTDEMYEELEIDFDRDLRDRNHLNIYGAEKVTDYIIKYLDEKFDLDDNRDNKKYDAWKTAGETFNGNYEDIIRKQTRKPVLNRVESVDYNTVKIIWNRVNCADGYVIYKKNEDKWEKIGEVDNSMINYFCDTVETGKDNVYTVKSYKKIDDNTIYSSYDEKGISGRAVTAVPYLYEPEYNAGNATLKWANVNGADGFVIYKKDGSVYNKIEDIEDSTANSYIVNESSIYTVRAYRIVNNEKVYGRYEESGIEISIP